MDPIELRRVNDTMTEPIDGKPYSSRSLMACYDEAATAFGWKRRNPRPGSMRDGDWLIGWGCATRCLPDPHGAGRGARAPAADGKVRVEIAAHEIGTGAYTVIGQVAAEQLGVPLRERLGRARRQRSAARAGRRRLQFDRQHLLGGDEGLRRDQANLSRAVDANERPLAGRDQGDGRADRRRLTRPTASTGSSKKRSSARRQRHRGICRM